jgi:hypothetical protein
MNGDIGTEWKQVIEFIEVYITHSYGFTEIEPR